MAHIDPDHITVALSWMQPGDVIELRALGVRTAKSFSGRTVSGYFDRIERLLRVLEKIPNSTGIYVTLNPVVPACLARAANRVDWLNDRDTRTADHDIARRVWFAIDCDPVRPKGISSTQEEWEHACRTADAIQAWLAERSWPEPLRAHSGNGMHLLYRLALPNDEASRDLLQRCLQALAFVFDDEHVLVDQANFNAARIWKLYGTMARKGDDLPDRPNRMAHILSGDPATLIVVPRERLQRLAEVLPQAEANAGYVPHGPELFDLESWVARWAADASGPEPWGRGGRRWRFAICPWNPEHRDRSAYIVELNHGGIAAGCHHNGCQGQDWKSLRALREPQRREAKRIERRPERQRALAVERQTSNSPSGKALLGVEDVVDSRLIWVASAADKAIIQAAGYRCCLAVPELPPVGANYRQHLRYLAPLEETLKRVTKHLYLFEDTPAGRAFTEALARRLQPEKGLKPLWPAECETLEHIVTIYGLDQVKETVETARPLPLPDVIEMDDVLMSVLDWYHHGGLPQGISPGWYSLSQIYRIRPGLVTLVTGVPSTGKSSVTSAMMVNLMQKHDWVVTIFSPEQAPATRYATMLAEQWLKKPFDTGPRPRMTEGELMQAMEELQERVTLIWPEEEEPTVEFLLEKARQEVFRRSIQGLVIDPWDEVNHQIGSDGREDLYIGRSLTKIRRFARTYNVHVWIIAHPRGHVDGTKAPGGYDISGGSKWRNKADNILSLRRDIGSDREHILEVHTAKIRFREDGIMGRKAELYFDKPTGTYSDHADLPNRQGAADAERC